MTCNKDTAVGVLHALGALLTVCGAACFALSRVVACILFVPGVLLFVGMQFSVMGSGGSLTLRRLRRQRQFGLVCILLSAVAMAMFTWDLCHGSFTFRFVHGNEWVPLLAVGALMLLYTAWRIPREEGRERDNKLPTR